MSTIITEKYGLSLVARGFHEFVPPIEGYKIDEHGQVLGPSGKILKPSLYGKVKISQPGQKDRHINPHRFVLRVFYPDITPLETVDHISENSYDHSIWNLQYMPAKGSESNTAKSNRLRPRAGGPARSRVVFELEGRCGVPKANGRYASIHAAAEALGLTSAGVSRSARKGSAAKGHFFAFEPLQFWPNEIAKTSQHLDALLGQQDLPDAEKIKATNFGRILHQNIFSVGSNQRYGKARVKKINGKNYYVHNLVYAAFNGPLPRDGETDANGNTLIVMHNANRDNSPLTQSGHYRNWPDDLTIGTRSENMTAIFKKKKHQTAGFKRSADEAELSPVAGQ